MPPAQHRGGSRRVGVDQCALGHRDGERFFAAAGKASVVARSTERRIEGGRDEGDGRARTTSLSQSTESSSTRTRHSIPDVAGAGLEDDKSSARQPSDL
jgi:hypothetical protein